MDVNTKFTLYHIVYFCVYNRPVNVKVSHCTTEWVQVLIQNLQ